ncbi:MAG: TonB-dependent receptor [Acidobacteria bacterium]|nr:TonB-dependent receptor [Acidobacteriota bacterium]
MAGRTRTRGRLVLAVAAFLLVVPSSGRAGTEAGPYRLLDAGGTPVGGARISVTGRAGSVLADAEGRFTLDPPPPLPYELVVLDARGAFLGTILVVDAAETELRLPEAARTELTVRTDVAPTTLGPPASAPNLVTREEMERRQPARMTDALAEIPGVGRLEEGQSVVPSVRGLARGRTLILLDDGRVTAERRAGPSASFLQPFMLQGLEIVRGPGSVAYGSDAIGGVIHARQPLPEPGVWSGRYEVSGGAGQPLATGGVALNLPLGTGAISFAGQQRWFGDYDSPQGTVDNSSARDRNLALAGLWPAGTARLWFNVYDGQTWDMGKPAKDSDQTRAWYPEERSTRLVLGADLPGGLGFDTLELRGFLGYYSLLTNRERFPQPGPPPVTRRLQQADVGANDASLRAAGSRSFGALRVSTGIEAVSRFNLEAIDITTRYDTAGQVTRVDRSESIEDAGRLDLGAFAEASLPFAGGALVAAAGTRYDWVETKSTGASFGDQQQREDAVTGFAAMTWHFAPAWEAALQWARAFRAPGLSELYFVGPTGRGVVTGNPDLQPETTSQWDLAVRRTAGSWRFAGYVYSYRIFDLIERYEDPVGSANFFFRNAGTQKLEGVELESEIDFGPRWVLGLGASWTRGEIVESGAFPADVPPLYGMATLLYRPADRWWLRLRGEAVRADDRPGPTEIDTPGYGLVGVGAGCQLSPLFGIELVVGNLFDHTYPATPDAVAADGPGRNAQLVLRGRW